jgi:hypothetical protein
MALLFAWDSPKAASNRRKHGVTFETATRVFADPNAVFLQDRVRNDEQRRHAIGMVEGAVMLLVVHVLYEDDESEIIRIISARHANRTERRWYEEANG